MKRVILIVLFALSSNVNLFPCLFTGEELIKNGSFDNDMLGFYTDYYFVKDPPMNDNAAYTITNDPNRYMPTWATFPDLSPSSNGKMFLTDAGSDTTDIVLGTDVRVEKNKTYQFSIWIARLNNASPPKIKIKINNVEKLRQTVTEGTGQWVNLKFDWENKNDTIAKIHIFNNNPQLYGNDIVFDEVSLKECYPESEILKITTNSPICEGDDIHLYAVGLANAKYFWKGPNNFSSNQQNPVIKNAKPINSGQYSLYITQGTNVSSTIYIDVFVSTFLVSPGDSSWLFVASAKRENKFFKLTDAKPWDGGSIWLKNRFSVKKNFITTFKFFIRNGSNNFQQDGSLPGADGIAFVLQNHNYPTIGDKGGSIGYTGITNSMAIEIDLFRNDWDPNGNHIAVQTYGEKPNTADHRKTSACMGVFDNCIEIQNDSTYFVKIDYNYDIKTLKIYLDSTEEFKTDPFTIDNIDLANLLKLEDGEYIYIGYTSGTGTAFQEHYIYDISIPCNNQIVNSVEDNPGSKITSNEVLKINPNPANNKTVLTFNVEDDTNLSVTLYDYFGNEISRIIESQSFFKGIYQQEILTDNLSEGCYFLVFRTNNLNLIEKLLIIK